MTDPTPLPAAPDWRALCKELLQAIDDDVIDTNDGPRFQAVVDCTRAALATPPAPPLEPRGCPLPGACSCPTTPIVPPELIRALEMAEEALTEIDLELGLRASQLPRIRRALQRWRGHYTPPAAPDTTREQVKAAIADALGGSAYDCLRVWSAWGIGTMGQDDFSPIAEDDDRVGEIADAAIAALATPPAVGATTAPIVEPADMKEREALAIWLERHYEYANDVNRPDWARMSIRAAALLRQATPPAATREAGLTDEQLLELMPQQFRDDLATVSRLASYGTPVGPGLYRVSLNTGALAYARAVLARWGGAAVRAVSAGAEISDEEWYALKDRLWDQHVAVGDQGERFMWYGDFDTALDLARKELARWGGAAVQPVPVSERLPEAEDLGEKGMCWWAANDGIYDHWRKLDLASALNNPWRPTHWLPHWALPVPAANRGETSP